MILNQACEFQHDFASVYDAFPAGGKYPCHERKMIYKTLVYDAMFLITFQ